MGRGGQGGKSAAAIIADAALEKGYFVQSFPEYGAERQGAPVYAYTRIDEKEIRIHSGVTNPDIVIVIDQTLLKTINVTDGMPNNGILIVNTNLSPEEIREKINYRNGRVLTVDATQISKDCFGVNIPNTPVLGSIEKATNLFSLELLKNNMRNKFLRKIGEQGVQKNITAIERAYNETKEG